MNTTTITAISDLAHVMGIDTFTFYNYLMDLKPSVEVIKMVLSKREKVVEDKPVIHADTADTADITKKSSTRKGNRKLTLKDKAKAGSNKWHHIDRMAESHPVYGLKRIQDMKLDGQEQMEYMETLSVYYKPTDRETYEAVFDAINKVNPYLYASFESYVSDIKNSVGVDVDFSDSMLDYIEAMAKGNWIEAQKRKSWLEDRVETLLEAIDNTERELMSLEEDLSIMYENLNDVMFGF